MAGTAFAAPQTVSAYVGPVPVPNVPVRVCVGSVCQDTPPLKSVFLVVAVTTETGAVSPTITPGGCGSGQGGTLTVSSGSNSALISGYVNGTMRDGSAFLRPLPAATVGANTTTVVSACAPPPPPAMFALSPFFTGLFGRGFIG